MNQFLANLTPRQVKMLYATVFIVVVALFDRLLIGPTMARIATIDTTIESEENSIKRDLRFLAYKDRILKEGKLFEPYYTDTAPKEEEVMSVFLEKLDNFIKDSGLTKIKNNRSADQPGQDNEPKDFFVYKADLECSGELENIAKLMYAIDTSKDKDLFKILKFNLAMKKTGEAEEMKIALTVAKYIAPSNSALLEPAAPKATSKTAAPSAANAR